MRIDQFPRGGVQADLDRWNQNLGTALQGEWGRGYTLEIVGSSPQSVETACIGQALVVSVRWQGSASGTITMPKINAQSSARYKAIPSVLSYTNGETFLPVIARGESFVLPTLNGVEAYNKEVFLTGVILLEAVK